MELVVLLQEVHHLFLPDMCSIINSPNVEKGNYFMHLLGEPGRKSTSNKSKHELNTHVGLIEFFHLTFSPLT